MKRVKILFTIPNFDSAGSGKHMIDLIRNLDLNSFEPHICCDHERGAYFDYVKTLGFPVLIRSLSPARGHYFKNWRIIYKNSRFLKSQKYDVIHSFHWKSDWFEPLAAKLAGIPWVYTKKSMVWNKHWGIRTFLASFVFTLNPEMVDLYPIPVKKSSCVGLGPNVDEVIQRCLAYDKNQVQSELGISGKFILLTVANLVPVKNIDFLLRAFSGLASKEQFHLFIVGDEQSEYGQSLRKFVEDNALSAHITFTGKVLDVEKYIAIADLYIQPTSRYGRSEASGVACMEACAAGVASIGSDVAGLRFVLGDQKLLFEPDNDRALQDTIERMYALPEIERKEIGGSLQKRMFQLFHIPKVAKDHAEVYLSLAGKI